MKQSVQVIRLSCLLLFLASSSVVLAFQARPSASPSSSPPLQVPQVVSPPASKTVLNVHTNENYIPPVVPTRSAARKGTRTISTRQPNDEKLIQGGQYLLEIGKCLQNAVRAKNNIDERGQYDDLKSRLFLQEAGSAIREMGVVWQDGDWEAVTYAALDASQTMALVAQSLNHVFPTNKLQRAFAGVAVELKCLSKKKKQDPDALNLQGFSLRLYQASRAGLNDDHDDAYHHQLEIASRAAQNLAKLYGATSVYLPRRWQLWWHNARPHNKDATNAHDNDKLLRP